MYLYSHRFTKVNFRVNDLRCFGEGLNQLLEVPLYKRNLLLILHKVHWELLINNQMKQNYVSNQGFKKKYIAYLHVIKKYVMIVIRTNIQPLCFKNCKHFLLKITIFTIIIIHDIFFWLKKYLNRFNRFSKILLQGLETGTYLQLLFWES